MAAFSAAGARSARVTPQYLPDEHGTDRHEAERIEDVGGSEEHAQGRAGRGAERSRPSVVLPELQRAVLVVRLVLGLGIVEQHRLGVAGELGAHDGPHVLGQQHHGREGGHGGCLPRPGRPARVARLMNLLELLTGRQSSSTASCSTGAVGVGLRRAVPVAGRRRRRGDVGRRRVLRAPRRRRRAP
jgi:hypothetical protein